MRRTAINGQGCVELQGQDFTISVGQEVMKSNANIVGLRFASL